MMVRQLSYKICLFAVILISACDSENNSPALLQATHDGGSNSCSFLFRIDGSYQWTNGSGLGVFTENGTYKITDSIITLDKIGFDKIILSHQLVMRPAKRSWDDRVKTQVFQIDLDKKVIPNSASFIVYLDNRQIVK